MLIQNQKDIENVLLDLQKKQEQFSEEWNKLMDCINYLYEHELEEEE